MFYQPLILTDGNWQQFKGRLADYPVRLSRLGKLESAIQVRSVALKYVCQGNENYLVGKDRHHLSANQFLLVNKFNNCEVSINHIAPSLGICIDLQEDYFSDVLATMKKPNEVDNPGIDNSFFLADELYSQGTYATGMLQHLLNNLATYSRAGNKFHLDDDFLRDITYFTILSQQELVKEYNRLPAVKPSTKKELHRRLLIAKAILQDISLSHLSIKEVGRMVCLSEFRFHHLFRKTFGTSPLQFQLKAILQAALLMRRNQSMPWVEVAEKTGFPDIQTFSKSFKKEYGRSPRNYERDISGEENFAQFSTPSAIESSE